MIDVPTYVRIFDPDPADDLVTKRSAAVKDLAARYSKSRAPLLIFQLAHDIAIALEPKSTIPDAMSKEVETAVRKAGADAFVAQGSDLQVLSCALMGALQVLESQGPVTGDATSGAVLAVGLWSALSFQQPRVEARLEALRQDVLSAARDLIIRSATSSRRRVKIGEFNGVAPKDLELTNIAQSVTTSVGPAIKALRTNAAIDREELDLLWWALGDWSDSLNRRYSVAPDAIATAIASGIDGGRLLRRMPGNAHRNLALRSVKGDKSFSIVDVIKDLGADRDRLAALYTSNETLSACPSVFPLLTALTTGSASHAKSRAKRSLSEWCERAMLEASALHVSSQLPMVV